MPPLDHLHETSRRFRDWHGFHSGWSSSLSAGLNEVLPDEFYAQPNVHYSIEIDVAAWEIQQLSAGSAGPVWSPPAPTATLPLPLLTDLVEVQVYRQFGGPQLVGAIEIVSPSNKDRPASRDAFVSKCAAYLQEGIGLVIVDIVTERRSNLHDAILARLDNGDTPPLGAELYAVAYHPVERDGRSEFDLWTNELCLGQPLPQVPLWLRGGFLVPVDLEAAYMRTCREQRIPSGGFVGNGAG